MGNCSSQVIGDLVARPGKKVSYKYALGLLYKFDKDMYESFSPNLWNPWEYHTIIKKVDGVRMLQFTHSAIEYLFKLEPYDA
jgi:hypothetical protein